MGWGVPVLICLLSMCDRCCWVCEILGFWLEWLFYGVCGLHLGDKLFSAEVALTRLSP